MTPDQQHVDEARRIAELAQMLDAAASEYSAGAWCNAANELLNVCRDQQERITLLERDLKQAEQTAGMLVHTERVEFDELRSRITLLEAERDALAQSLGQQRSRAVLYHVRTALGAPREEAERGIEGDPED